MDELEGRFAKVDDDTHTGMTLHTVVTLIVSVLAVVLILFGLWAGCIEHHGGYPDRDG